MNSEEKRSEFDPHYFMVQENRSARHDFYKGQDISVHAYFEGKRDVEHPDDEKTSENQVLIELVLYTNNNYEGFKRELESFAEKQQVPLAPFQESHEHILYDSDDCEIDLMTRSTVHGSKKYHNTYIDRKDLSFLVNKYSKKMLIPTLDRCMDKLSCFRPLFEEYSLDWDNLSDNILYLTENDLMFKHSYKEVARPGWENTGEFLRRMSVEELDELSDWYLGRHEALGEEDRTARIIIEKNLERIASVMHEKLMIKKE